MVIDLKEKVIMKATGKQEEKKEQESLKKILYIRGDGDKIYDDHPEVQQKYAEYKQAVLNILLAPYTIQIPVLNSTAKAELWMKTLEQLPIESYDLIMGHSSGVQAAMRLAEKRKIKALLIIGGHFSDLEYPEELSYGWFDKKWDWKTIQKNTNNEIYQLSSKNDPFIPFEHSCKLHQLLNSVHFIKAKAEHFGTWFNTQDSGRLKTVLDKILTRKMPQETKDNLRFMKLALARAFRESF